MLTFSIFTTTLSAQETDTIAEKPEPDAINTGSASIFDSAAVARYENVDHIVLAMKKLSKKTPILAKEITAPFTSEEEKVRALFVWVTNNISYDCAAYHAKPPHAGNLSYKTQAELEAKLDKYYSNIATLTVRNKKAVCEGYSVLFWQLCKVNGIHCQLVDGRASENKDKIKRLRSKKKFNTNHMWNKVQVNGVWYYIDVTWASGYCDPPVTKFFKKFNPFYFLTPLDKLFPTHAENIKLTEKRNHPISE
ncbi:MAG: hypothetical protein HY062_00845 [Bacteroidetes bacterium]|nr:hypothetical protein [Bacteroidota bacterium]